jgi:hypothetical protein
MANLRPHTRIQAGTPQPDMLVYLQEEGLVCPFCGGETGFSTLDAEGHAARVILGVCCDFCGRQDPIAITFPCRTFVIDGYEYADGWAACAACAALVEQGDREGLVSRAVAHHCERNPRTVQAMLAEGKLPGVEIRHTQAGFWTNRITDEQH